MAHRIPNPAAIDALRGRVPTLEEAVLRPLALVRALRHLERSLERLEALAGQAPAPLAPSAPEQLAGTLRGARRSLEKWAGAIEAARPQGRSPGERRRER